MAEGRMKYPIDIVLEQVTLPFEKLHKYQEDDINLLAPVWGCGLMHGLGLGKTVIALMIGAYKIITGTHDIVYVLCPETLITQWVDEATTMGFDVIAYRGTPKGRKKFNINQNILVMSFQIFQKDYERLKKKNMYFIIDEATIMCNPDNKLYTMINGGEKTKYTKVPGKLKPVKELIVYDRLNTGCALLSATPINKPVDAYGFIETKTPGIYRNKSQFERIHVEKYDFFDQPTAYRDLDLLHDNLMVNSVHRLVTDHIDLPPLVMKTVKYDMSPKHYKLYESLVRERVIVQDGKVLIDAKQAMRFYNWAQKLILNPDQGGFDKDPVGLEILDGLIESVNNFLVFGNYRMTNGKIMERYNIGGVYGEVTSKKQQEYLKDFKELKIRGLTCHSRSGGYGHNLPMCHHVFFPEIPVTPRDMIQSVGRVYRQGQRERVIVTVMVAKNTIQETLFKKFLEKDDLMTQVVRTEKSLRESLLGDVVIADRKKTKAEVVNELLGK